MSLASRKLIQAAAGGGDPSDDDFANVVLLLDGDGTSGDANNTFTDSSTNGFTVTKNGDVVQGSFSPYGDNWSNYFASGANVLKVTDSADFDLGTTWTVEAWIFPNAANGSKIFGTRNGSGNMWELLIYTSAGNFAFEGYGANNTSGPKLSSSTFELGQWYHVAVVTSSSATKLYVDGVLEINYSNSLTWSTAYGPWIGGTSAFSEYAFDGYVSNLRVVKGTAVYTSEFTPPTEPLTAITNTVLLTCQSNRFVDNSSSSHTITVTGTPKVTPFSPFKNDDARTLTTDGGSAYFDGTDGDSENHLDLGAARIPASGDFTFETWIKVSPKAGNQTICSQYLNSQTGRMIFFVRSSSGATPNTISLSISFISVLGTTVVADNTWHHVALERSGNNWYLYVDGALDNSGTSSGSIYTGQNTRIGNNRNTAGSDNPLKGYLSDCRLTTSAVYGGSSYTVPTAPISAITNTSILLNFQDAGIYDRSGINNLDTVGNARLGFAPIYGTGSLAFDGTGDYLSMPVEPRFDFGTANFTIESWVNLNATGQFNPIIYLGRDTYTGIVCDVSSSNNPRIIGDIGGSWIAVATGSTALEKNRWYHLAFVRNGSSFKIYVDGVEDASATNSGSITAATSDSSSVAQVGYLRTNGGADRYFNGYLDDVRVTKSIARYTSAFTPPDEIDLSTDTHREYVTLFLDGDGTVNGQNNTFTDSSTNDFTVTKNGSVAQGVFSPYGDNWSNYFDGSGDYLGLSSSSDFALGTGDFTIEFWFYAVSIPSATNILDMRNGSSGLVINFPNGVLGFYSEPAASYLKQTSTLNANEWYHVAAVRNGTDFDLYINGTAIGSSATNSSNFSASTTVTIGARWTRDQQYFPGYISNVRLVKGTAVYTSNFTVPTSPLTAVTNTKLLTCASNNFSDGSLGNHSLTLSGNTSVTRFSPFESNKPYDITTDGGSGYFDVASTAYLSFSGGPSSVSDMTISGWVYPETMAPQAGNAYPRVFAAGGFLIYVRDDDIRIYNGGEKVQAPIDNNEWTYFAAQRNSNTWTLYINGVSQGTASDSSNIALNSTNYIGSNGASNYFTGYIADLRITTSGSTSTAVPTAPVSAVTNTELLLNFQDSAIPDLSGLNNIDTVGNAKVDGTDPTKYGSNAMQFDGSGDYLDIPANSELGFGSGAFTIELWAFFTASTSYQAIVSSTNYYTGGYNGNWLLRRDSNSLIAFATYNGTSTEEYLQFSASTSLNTWYHIALVREGTGTNQTKLYLDGTLKGSMTVSKSLDDGAVSGVRVGKDTQNADLSGYLDDLRITKGIARYTANFTPPSEALPKF